MLVRLTVDGFKNLVDFDMRFGPVTCIAGNNGVGKSNIFDAIDFLRRLADDTLLNAAMGVRSSGAVGEPRRLFHAIGSEYASSMRFKVEMLIPATGVDDLGQSVEASVTFLFYELIIGWRELQGPDERGGLYIKKEELGHIRKGDAAASLLFPHKKHPWREEVVAGKGNGHRTAKFISTSVNKENRPIVQLHQDGQGKPQPFLLDPLPRTLLSTATAADGPTVALARKEMRSWAQLHLEPSAMRAPSDFFGSTLLKPNGDRLAAALHRLATSLEPEQAMPLFASTAAGPRALAETRVCSAIANRLSDLIGEVDRVWVERDERRQVLTLCIGQRGGAAFPASSLSDGTLRFLAMALIKQDPDFGRVICLEEPENGLHPTRVPAMLELLYGIAVDTNDSVGPENPNRQIIFNTYSPLVVQNVLAGDLVIAHPSSGRLEMSCLPSTWRSRHNLLPVAPLGVRRAYIDSVRRIGPDVNEHDLALAQLNFGFDPVA
ncbi:MAG: AAA family ATPase [Bryobacterales bacterium]|nr:AAA family ATPase [Bryobacterales bacterium]